MGAQEPSWSRTTNHATVDADVSRADDPPRASPRPPRHPVPLTFADAGPARRKPGGSVWRMVVVWVLIGLAAWGVVRKALRQDQATPPVQQRVWQAPGGAPAPIATEQQKD